MKFLTEFNILCAIIAAKWAFDLGVSQLRQVLFGLAGLFFGPLALLALYVFLLYQAKKEGRPAARVF